MKVQLNFHRKIGLKPGFIPRIEIYGSGIVFIIRLWWSAITLTLLRKK